MCGENLEKGRCDSEGPDIKCRLSCKHRTSQARSPVLFEADGQPDWSSGLTADESRAIVRSGKSSSMDIHPVSSTTEHDIILPKRFALGRLQLVRSVTPLQVHLKGRSTANQNDSPIEYSEMIDSTMKSLFSHENAVCKVPEVNLSGLPEQQQQATEMSCRRY